MWKVIATGWQVDEFLERFLHSVCRQSRGDWELWGAIDGPGPHDAARAFVDQHQDSRLHVYYNEKRQYATENIVMLMELCGRQPDDRIALVDMDDQMLPAALDMAESYHAFGKWVTYGSYESESGRPARFKGAYPPTTNLRTAKWRATHLRTFRSHLWDHLKVKDLRGPDGLYYRTSWDMAIMLPLMEMAGPKRCTHVPVPLYVYNDLNPANDHKLARDDQKRMERHIRRRAPYRRLP